MMTSKPNLPALLRPFDVGRVLALFLLASLLLMAGGNRASSQEEDAATPSGTTAEPETPDVATEEGDKAADPETDDRPLYERDPYDIVHLDSSNQNAELVVEPIDFPSRKVPDPLPDSGVLEVRFVDEPTEVFDVEWSHIVKIEPFELLIVKEGNRLTREASSRADERKYSEAQQKFDDAYWYFEYVAQHAPETRRLNASIENFLMKNAAVSFSAGQYTDALSILSELQRRNPNRRGLGASQRRVVDSLFKANVKQRSFWQARHLLSQWEASPDPRWKQFVASRTSQLSKLAVRQLQQAKQHFSERNYRDARRALLRALEVLPDVPGGAFLGQQIAQQFPVVTVGVRQSALPDGVPSLANWSANRRERLLTRKLVEFDGPSAQGGDYLFPWGTLRSSDDGTSLQMNLRPGRPDAADSLALSSYVVTQRLLDMADRQSPDYRVTWTAILNSVNVKNAVSLNIQLEHTFVKPEALFQVRPWVARDKTDTLLTGPYRLSSTSDGETVYMSQTDFALSSPTQPQQVVERHVSAGTVSHMLRLGEIDVVDRVNPIEVEQLRNQADIVVERYDIPTVHVLVPNVKENSFLDDNLFRRALVYGLNRELILSQMILGGSDLAGCQLLSGPFPAGLSPDDPLGYAYHFQTSPLPYHRAMAKILSAVAVAGAKNRAAEAELPEPELKPLILAYPSTDAATIACQVMAEQLQGLEIPCELRPLPPGVVQPDDGYDLLYMEWTITEPVVDAGRLFGDGGLVRSSSAYLKHTLRQLDRVTNWVEARELLNKVHQIVHQEVTVIPLWQLTEHLAYHKRLQGIESQPVHLYQNVEQWRISP